MDRKESSFLLMKVKAIKNKYFAAGHGTDLQDLKGTVYSFYQNETVFQERSK